MILDDNLVSIDHVQLSSGVITGEAIALTSLFKPGRHHEAIPMNVSVSPDMKGGTQITLSLQQADSKDGSFIEVDGSELIVTVDNMEPGTNIGWRYLPSGVTKQWIKIVATPGGTFTGGTLFAAIVRDDEMPYSEGLYLDRGVDYS
jgi:hypothetical protein